MVSDWKHYIFNLRIYRGFKTIKDNFNNIKCFNSLLTKGLIKQNSFKVFYSQENEAQVYYIKDIK